MDNNIKNTGNLDKVDNPLKIKSFKTVVNEMKESYEEDICNDIKYSTGEEFEVWLKGRKRHNKER